MGESQRAAPRGYLAATGRTPPVYLSARAVREMTGLSESTVRRLRKARQFPAPIRMTPGPAGHLRWLETEITDWLESRREVVS